MSRERNKALMRLDVDWAIANATPLHGGKPPSKETMLIALHKARYECSDIPAELRHSSATWLRERGHSGLSEPVLQEGELP